MMTSSRRKFVDVLPLQVFVQRSQVKKAYRDLLKATRPCIDPILKNEIREHIRESFRRNQHLENQHAIKPLIQEALSSVRIVQDLCIGQSKPHIDISQRQSWLEEKDDIDERGRMGDGWPWESRNSRK